MITLTSARWSARIVERTSYVPFQKQQKGEESDEELPKGSKPDGLEDDELDEDVESSEEEYVAGNLIFFVD